jgi:uncharacterized protein YndB with AHSA1/START domain
MSETSAVVCEVLLEIAIDAPRERVWEAIVEETASWWHKDFYTGPGAVGFHMQPKLGGFVYEDWGDGNGQLWGTVTGVRAPEYLQSIGDTSPDWGGPNRGIMDWRLEAADDGGTLLRFRHALFGNVSEQTRASLQGGWTLLLEQCLKAYAETGERPAIADGDAPACGA